MSVFTNPAGGAIEHAHAYVAAILELLGDKDPIAVLRATAPALERVVDTTPHHVLVRPEAPGKWSMGEVLAHLADSDLVWGWRLRLILAQDRPPLTGYDQDAWARLARQPFAAMLESYTVLRAANLNLIRNTPAGEHDRVGVHSERGRMSFRLLYQEIAGHDRAHLRQLEQTIAAVTG